MNQIMEVRDPWWHIGVGIRHCHLGRCCDPGSIPGPGNFCIPQVRQKNNNDDGNIPSQEFSFNCLHFSLQLGFTSTGGISLVRPQKTPYSRNTGKDWKQDRIVTYYQRESIRIFLCIWPGAQLLQTSMSNRIKKGKWFSEVSSPRVTPIWGTAVFPKVYLPITLHGSLF